MDAIIQALSGVMLTSGGPQDPPLRIGVPFADLGVLTAIHQAQRTGLGRRVDVSLLGVITMLVSGEPFHPGGEDRKVMNGILNEPAKGS